MTKVKGNSERQKKRQRGYGGSLVLSIPCCPGASVSSGCKSRWGFLTWTIAVNSSAYQETVHLLTECREQERLQQNNSKAPWTRPLLGRCLFSLVWMKGEERGNNSVDDLSLMHHLKVKNRINSGGSEPPENHFSASSMR